MEVTATVGKFNYKPKTEHYPGGAMRYVLILGKYITKNNPKIAGIDLRAMTRDPSMHMGALNKLRIYLPDILGWSPDEGKIEKPTLNPSMLKYITKEYGIEGIKKLSKIIQSIQEHPEEWRTKIANKDLPKEQLDLISAIDNLPKITTLEPRPLKSTVSLFGPHLGTKGRYDMGRRIVEDPAVNRAFALYYRTYSIDRIEGAISTDVLTALDRPEELKSKLKLYEVGLESIQRTLDEIVEKKLPEKIPPKEVPEVPEVPEIKPEVPEIEPEEEEEEEFRLPMPEKPEIVATPEKPKYQPPPKAKEAPKEVLKTPKEVSKRAPEELEPKPEEKKDIRKEAQKQLLGQSEEEPETEELEGPETEEPKE